MRNKLGGKGEFCLPSPYYASSLLKGSGSGEIDGRVTANHELREQFRFKIQSLNSKIKFLVPPKNFCTDNAVMAALTGYYHQKEAQKKNFKNIEAKANLRLE